MVELLGDIFLSPEATWQYPIAIQWTETVVEIGDRKFFSITEFLETVKRPRQGTKAAIHLMDKAMAEKLLHDGAVRVGEKIVLFGGPQSLGYFLITHIDEHDHGLRTPKLE